MTNGTMLRTIAKEKRIPLNKIAEGLNITRQGLANKLDGVYEFKVSEVNVVSSILGLSLEEKNAIFFAD